MKKIITSVFALAAMFGANAQMADGVQARIYAYGLEQEETTKTVANGDIKSYVITFKTNCAATEANVLLTVNGETRYSVEATATDDTKKSWKAIVDADAVEGITAGTYNWSAEVSAEAVTSLQLLVDTSNKYFHVYRSFGVCVDNNPENDYFGRVYMASQYAYTNTNSSRLRATECGMYTFTADLTPENDGNAYSCEIMGGETSSGTSPADMCVSKDGRLFVAVNDATKYGIYYINPNDFSYSNVFTNTTIGTDSYSKTALLNNDNTRLTGIRGALTTIGSNENTELIVLDSDIYASLYHTPFNCFTIGNSNEWTNTSPSSILANSSNRMKYSGTNIYVHNGKASLESTNNGFWVIQTSKTFTGSNTITVYNDSNHPAVFYYSLISGKVECIDNTITSNDSPALAVNGDLGLVAYTPTGTSNPIVKKYTENEETGAIEVTKTVSDYDLYTEMTTKADAMAFDYAGNLYAVTSGKEKLRIYALPDDMVGENTRTTPAKSNLTVEITSSDIATGIVEVGVDATAPVEYYNLQGVKVENPSNGIFIKKQGNKTTKVVL